MYRPTFASTTHFTSSHPPSLIVWPKKESLRHFRSTILLIRSFSRQLSSESIGLRHIYENRPHQRAHYTSVIVSSLCIPLSLQIEHYFLGHSNSTTSINLCNSYTRLIIPTFRSLFFFTFNFSSLDFPMLLTFPIIE